MQSILKDKSGVEPKVYGKQSYWEQVRKKKWKEQCFQKPVLKCSARLTALYLKLYRQHYFNFMYEKSEIQKLNNLARLQPPISEKIPYKFSIVFDAKLFSFLI